MKSKEMKINRMQDVIDELRSQHQKITKVKVAELTGYHRNFVTENWNAATESNEIESLHEKIKELEKENLNLKVKIADLESKKKDISSIEQRKTSTHLLNHTASKTSSDSWLHFQKRR